MLEQVVAKQSVVQPAGNIPVVCQIPANRQDAGGRDVPIESQTLSEGAGAYAACPKGRDPKCYLKGSL